MQLVWAKWGRRGFLFLRANICAQCIGVLHCVSAMLGAGLCSARSVTCVLNSLEAQPGQWERYRDEQGKEQGHKTENWALKMIATIQRKDIGWGIHKGIFTKKLTEERTGFGGWISICRTSHRLQICLLSLTFLFYNSTCNPLTIFNIWGSPKLNKLPSTLVP